MTPPAAAAAPAVAPRRPAAPSRRRTAPARPRRVSGPVRPRTTRPSPRPSEAHGGLALGLLATLDGLSRHRFLDRLLRGRTAIAFVAFALIGIVTLQLGLLKLNSSIGRTLERESALQRENAALSIENSELAAGARVEARAAQLGMEFVPLEALRFLTARPRIDPARGAAALKAQAQGPGGGSPEAGPPGSGSAASSGAPQSDGEQPTPQASAPPTSSDTASAPAGETPQTGGESASPPASAPAPAAAQPPGGESPSSAGSSTVAGSAEAAPGGGTQAGSTG